jgi:hypothetical protein
VGKKMIFVITSAAAPLLQRYKPNIRCFLKEFITPICSLILIISDIPGFLIGVLFVVE